MNSNKLGIIDDVKVPRVIARCHRGTQTNENSDQSLQSSKSKGTSPQKGSSQDVAIKIFEYNQIVQDTEHPEIIAVIRDSFSEETLDHPNEKSKDPTSNRYKYCREVIKPFLSKDYSNNCQSSDEDIIKDVLESVQKDYPDFKPCFKTCSVSPDQCKKKDSPTKNLQPPVCKAETFLCDKVEAKSPTDIGSLIFPIALCPSSLASDKSNTSGTSMDKKKNDDYDGFYDPCAKPKCEKKPSKKKCEPEIPVCKKPKSESKKPPPPSCKVNEGPQCTIKLKSGCESEEDLKELEKQRKKAAAEACAGGSPGGSKIDLLPPPSSPPGQKTIIESHCEALDTVMQAASTVLSKALDVTMDAVNLIQKESARHLEKIRASKSECEDMCNAEPPPQPKKKDPCEISNILGPKNVLEKNVLENNILEKNVLENNILENNVLENNVLENFDKVETLDAEDVLHKMVEKIDSTISMISEHIDFDAIANILKSDDDNKNIYDRPTTPPQLKLRRSSHSREEQPSVQQSIHESVQSNINTASNVFTAIKSKIFSIFSEVTKGTDKPEEQNPEITDDDDEN